MKVTIESVDNGYVVTGPNPSGEGESLEVFQKRDDDPCPEGALISALWAVKEFLGEYGDKFSQHVTVIRCEPGHKVDDAEPCPNRSDL